MHTLSPASPATGTPAAPTADGVLPRLLTRWLFRPATVEQNEPVAPGIHRITLAGPALRGVRWAPGDKLQIKLGTGMQTRTYTPVAWDTDQGRTWFLAHALAWGPGSEWVRRAQPGQQVAVLGPRRSLDLSAIDAHRGLVVGDETAISLACAWQPQLLILESHQPAGIQTLVDKLGLRATVVARQAGDDHWPALRAALLARQADAGSTVLVGRARTVQHLLRALRASGVPGERIRTKAYWADGKAGLD